MKSNPKLRYALEKAEAIICTKDTTTYPSGAAARHVREVMRQLVECVKEAMASASPQGDRNEQIKAMIARFDEKVKTWTPQQALDYLVELGTHDADGNLTPEYGGSSPQGNEMWEVLGEDWSISRLLNELTDPYGDNQDDAAIMKKAAKVIEYMQRVSRISGPERIKAQ